MKKEVIAAVLAVASALGVVTVIALDSSSGSNANLAQSCVAGDVVCVQMAALVADASSAVDAFDRFQKMLDEDPSMRQNCHTSSHNVGSAIWTKFGESSFVPGGGTCAFGIYHGILQQIAKTAPGELQSRAEVLCSTLGKLNRSQGEECVHGIGHALALVVDDLNEAYEQCHQLPSTDAGKCDQGATMEWIIRFQQEIPLPTEVCAPDTLPAAMGACVNVAYSQELIRDESRLATAGCDQFDESLAMDCWSAIGNAVGHYSSRAADPMKYLSLPLCATNESCTGSMIIAHLMNSGTTAGGEALCEKISLREICLASLEIAQNLNRSLDG
jgi:hypothetical protein